MIFCVRPSGEANLGTIKYVSKRFVSQICSRLRRGDFRYTKLCSVHALRFFVRASGEAILGTLKYFSQRFIR